MVVIGDFDPNAVRALLAERLDGWRSPKPFSDVLNLYSNLAKDPTTEDFNTPDKENAFFLGGMPIEMRDSHADYPALVFGNYILGSGPASRLFGASAAANLELWRKLGFNAPRAATPRTSRQRDRARRRGQSRSVVPRRARQRAPRRLHRRGFGGREGELGRRAGRSPHTDGGLATN